MSEDKYLINFYKVNNPVLERINIKRKLISRTLIFIISSLLYFIMSTLSDLSKYKGEVSIINALTPLKIIMFISSGIGLIGLIILIFAIISPIKFENIYSKISFKIKKRIFVIMDWLSVFPICAVVTIFCFSYLFIIMEVSGPSMQPTLQNGEHVLVLYNKEIKRESVVIIDVKASDNIVYNTTSENWIKRVIGLPGDTVVWTSDCKLYINGSLYEENYFPDNHFNQNTTFPNKSGDTVNGSFQYKDENGVIHTTMVIPEGYYFVMGDHRDNSKDSRHIGLVSEENIIGVATHLMDFVIPRGKIQ